LQLSVGKRVLFGAIIAFAGVSVRRKAALYNGSSCGVAAAAAAVDNAGFAVGICAVGVGVGVGDGDDDGVGDGVGASASASLAIISKPLLLRRVGGTGLLLPLKLSALELSCYRTHEKKFRYFLADNGNSRHPPTYHNFSQSPAAHGSSQHPLPSPPFLLSLAAHGNTLPLTHSCHFLAGKGSSRQHFPSPHFCHFLAAYGISRDPLSSPHFRHFLAAQGSFSSLHISANFWQPTAASPLSPFPQLSGSLRHIV